MHHIHREDWKTTPKGDPRGYIDPTSLSELWFHTGTACNLSCSFCLEGSKPGDKRIEQITFDEAKLLIDEAKTLGTQKFSFTGGEPFINKDMIKILEYALETTPCLVLTNGTLPTIKKMPLIKELKKKPNPVDFRISFDFPDPARHDKERGEGNFMRALNTIAELHREGFNVSIARHQEDDEDVAKIDAAYQKHFESVGLPKNIPIISFPDFMKPGSIANVPYVTESCMTTYKDEKQRSEFMCTFSKMVVKKNGKIGIYACTLVDDDPDYDMGPNLTESMRYRVMLKHHRCYSCFAYGASCSEKKPALAEA